MRRQLAIAAIAATALAAGCHRGGSGSQSEGRPAPTEKGLPLSDFQAIAKQRGGKPEVMRMMVVTGRWEGQPGAVAGIPTRHLVLTVANDNRFSLDLTGRDPKATMDTVDVDIRGAISWSAAGILSGTGTGARPPLKGFGSWRASFPKAGSLHLVGSDGKAYDLVYRGA